jgi:hypothetical protein
MPNARFAPVQLDFPRISAQQTFPNISDGYNPLCNRPRPRESRAKRKVAECRSRRRGEKGVAHLLPPKCDRSTILLPMYLAACPSLPKNVVCRRLRSKDKLTYGHFLPRRARGFDGPAEEAPLANKSLACPDVGGSGHYASWS